MSSTPREAAQGAAPASRARLPGWEEEEEDEEEEEEDGGVRRMRRRGREEEKVATQILRLAETYQDHRTNEAAVFIAEK